LVAFEKKIINLRPDLLTYVEKQRFKIKILIFESYQMASQYAPQVSRSQAKVVVSQRGTPTGHCPSLKDQFSPPGKS